MAIAFVCTALVVSDVIQRLFVATWVRLRPSARIPVLSGWIKLMAWLVTRPVGFLGGFRVPRPPRIVPGRPGVLVLMNHQSLYDIPLVVQAMVGGYPRIVTRERYTARWIPLISYMVRLYQYPVVDPSANRGEIRRTLLALGEAAANSDVPLAVFPEGTRTRNGEIGRFRRGALNTILASRPWTVYVFVVDGFWKAGRFRDFTRKLSGIEGKMEHVATLEWPDPEVDPGPFVTHVRELMVERLRDMRAGSSAA